MIQITKKENCCGCHACQTACPLGCIAMVLDNEGFLYPLVNENICIDCGICENVCPIMGAPRQGDSPLAFAAWNRDAAIRAQSSSGGCFSALMRQTFKQNGVVFGAGFDATMTLRHQSAQNEFEALKFRGSKYLQSVIGDAYHKAKIFLQQGRHVLFSGTPCQIAGLYAYLGKDDSNLITCEVVCHGVPSPRVFAAYKAAMECRYEAKIKKIAFRRKDYGWKRYCVVLSFENATEYRRIFTDDPYMIGFLQNTYLRPSCHTCRFSRLPRVADISLADFWGVREHHPEWDDDKGTSLVLAQSKKGHEFFNLCRDALVVHEADLAVAIRSNPCICGSVSPGRQRTAYFTDLDKVPFDLMMKKYMAPPSTLRKAINLTRRTIGYALRRMRFLTISI